MMRFYLLFYVLLFTFYVLISPASAQVRFTNVTEAVGLGDVIIPALATWGDYDNDGDLDLVPTSGFLYRNEGNGRFANVTEAVGMDVAIGARASAFGDFDNDGNLDLFIGGVGSVLGNVLYRNRGDGTFLNVSRVADMKSKVESYFGALSFDYNNDGLLDIFIGNWSDSTPYPNLLYRNEGGFRFKEIAAQVGLDKPEFSMGLALGDYDNDGDLDVFIGVSGPTGEAQGIDVLYRNEGGNRFIDVAQQAGVQRKSNHVSAFFFDYDNDDDLDLFVQAWYYRDEDGLNILYRNNGNGSFTDVAQEAGIAPVKKTSAGAYYGDYDNDGWLDLCITYNNLPTLLYHNNGNGTFTEVSKEAEIGGTNTGTTSLVDYDNDGDLDILTGAWSTAKLRLYRNDGAPNHWLKLKLIGSKSNRDAIGARIKVIAGRLSMLREIAGSAGIGSHQDRLPVHFGLEKNTKSDMIEIRWPSGIIQTFTNISADQQLTIDESEGILLVVRNVFSAFGDPKGSTPVQIHGEHFAPGSQVFFGGIEASDVRVESPSLITAVTPPGATGVVDVEVVRPDGKRGILRNGFRYTALKIIKITPESGPITGGITVQIEGIGFQRGAEVQIGGGRLTNVFVTTGLIRGMSPPGAAGITDVLVTNPSGEKDVLKGAFAYVPPPTFRNVSPISPIFIPLTGLGGEITINGSGFFRTPNVQIGGIAAQRVDFISSNELNISTRQFPAVGPQDVVVINPDGQRAVLSQGVTVLAPIKIKSVEPASGGLEGGTKITIVGEPTVEFAGRNYPSRFVGRFVEETKVFIGNVEAEGEKVLSDHVITAITPPNTPGPKDVRVVNVDDQSDILKNAFSYNPLPQITKIIPNNGPLSGGTKISIQGSKFLSGAQVIIGDVDRDSFFALSPTQVESDSFLTAITPSSAGETGPKDVVVRNPDGQEVVLRDGFTYNPFPTIRDISPNYGPSSGGTKVIIRGTGFLQRAKVIIGKNFATTEFKDDATIEAVTPANPKGKLDVKVINPDTQEAVIERAFISVGELAYNYPNPFQASRGTTFRYVPGPNESVESIVVRVFNLAGVPIGVVGAEGTNEVRWQDSRVNVGLYVYLMEVKVGGQVKRFKRALEVYK